MPSMLPCSLFERMNSIPEDLRWDWNTQKEPKLAGVNWETPANYPLSYAVLRSARKKKAHRKLRA